MAWIFLLAAIGCEVTATSLMKLSNGFRRVGPAVGMVFFYLLSFGGLTMALEDIDVSIAYAVWAGLGTAGIAVIGAIYFGEPMNLIKVLSIGLIILGIVGLNLSVKHA